MREMPTKPRRRGANHDALMVSAPRFANTEGQRTAAGGPTGPQSWAAGKETQ